MKITSNKYKGTSLLLFSEKVEFNVKGEAEVSKELGEKILSEYGTLLNKPSEKEEVKEVVNSASDDKLKELVEKLQSEKEILGQRVEALTGDLETSKADANNWKEEFTKLQEKGEGENPVIKTTKQDVELVLELEKKSKGDLEAMAEELGFSEDEWGEFNKEDLIIYLAIQAIDANA